VFTIKVRPGDNGRIEIDMPYDAERNAIIRTIQGRIWVRQKKVWSIPGDWKSIQLLRQMFPNDRIELDPALQPDLSEVSMRNIIDHMILMDPPFYGRLDLVEFLSRIWDLSSLPSTDGRFKTATGDIWQHMINNNDWDYDYLFYGHLQILTCPVETVLKLVETLVHPVVVTDDKTALKIATAMNDILGPDGYVLAISNRISGRPLYKATVKALVHEARSEATRYDVALSFAGEEREYVYQVAEFLKARGIDVFYDEFEEAVMWGKDLAEHLNYVYGKGARYCVMFISENYARKAWPNYERRSAIVRAVSERQEYILPARFDKTEVPGLLPTTVYVDLTKKTPLQIGELIVKKLEMV
jgi:AbiJ-like protein/TIR domain-containing protein